MCCLKIYSEKVSFKDFADQTTLSVYSVHDKGDVRHKKKKTCWEEYRISIEVSDAEWDEFDQQVIDAIEFLENNHAEIANVLSLSDDTYAYLDFPLWSRLDKNIVNQNDHLPPKLVKLLGKLNIGIEMAVYAKDAFDF